MNMKFISANFHIEYRRFQFIDFNLFSLEVVLMTATKTWSGLVENLTESVLEKNVNRKVETKTRRRGTCRFYSHLQFS